MATLRRNIAVSVLFTLFGGPGLVLVLGPWLITRFRIPAGQSALLLALSCLLIAAGLIPLFESITRFVLIGRGTLMPSVPTEHLVVSGLYRYVRNPMYAGGIVVLAGEIVLFRSPAMIPYAALIWLGFDLFVRLYEERRLAATYGTEYDRFKAAVPRWVPRLRPWNPSA